MERFNEIIAISEKGFPQGSFDWLRLRLSGWGSSEIPSLMGRNPFKYSNACVAEKAFLVESNFCNAFMEHGKKYEDVVTAYIARRYGSKVYKTTCVPTKIPDEVADGCEGYDIMFDSSDGQLIIDGKPVVIEIKCPAKRKIKSSIPGYYADQVQNHLFNTGFERCIYIDCDIRKTDELVEGGKDKSGLIGISPTVHGTIIPETWPGDSPDWETRARAEILAIAPDAVAEYWAINDIAIIDEKPNRRWFREVYPVLTSQWDIVMKYRNLLIDEIIRIAGLSAKSGPALAELKGLLALLLGIRPEFDSELARHLSTTKGMIAKLRETFASAINTARGLVIQSFWEDMRSLRAGGAGGDD